MNGKTYLSSNFSIWHFLTFYRPIFSVFIHHWAGLCKNLFILRIITVVPIKGIYIFFNSFILIPVNDTFFLKRFEKIPILVKRRNKNVHSYIPKNVVGIYYMQN